MPVFDLTLAGFDAGTDKTDHLVKWIDAPREEAIRIFAADIGLKDFTIEPLEGRDDLDFEDGLDLVLDEDGHVVMVATNVNPLEWPHQKPLPS